MLGAARMVVRPTLEVCITHYSEEEAEIWASLASLTRSWRASQQDTNLMIFVFTDGTKGIRSTLKVGALQSHVPTDFLKAICDKEDEPKLVNMFKDYTNKEYEKEDPSCCAGLRGKGPAADFVDNAVSVLGLDTAHMLLAKLAKMTELFTKKPDRQESLQQAVGEAQAAAKQQPDATAKAEAEAEAKAKKARAKLRDGPSPSTWPSGYAVLVEKVNGALEGVDVEQVIGDAKEAADNFRAAKKAEEMKLKVATGVAAAKKAEETIAQLDEEVAFLDKMVAKLKVQERVTAITTAIKKEDEKAAADKPEEAAAGEEAVAEDRAWFSSFMKLNLDKFHHTLDLNDLREGTFPEGTFPEDTWKTKTYKDGLKDYIEWRKSGEQRDFKQEGAASLQFVVKEKNGGKADTHDKFFTNMMTQVPIEEGDAVLLMDAGTIFGSNALPMMSHTIRDGYCATSIQQRLITAYSTLHDTDYVTPFDRTEVYDGDTSRDFEHRQSLGEMITAVAQSRSYQDGGTQAQFKSRLDNISVTPCQYWTGLAVLQAAEFEITSFASAISFDLIGVLPILPGPCQYFPKKLVMEAPPYGIEPYIRCAIQSDFAITCRDYPKKKTMDRFKQEVMHRLKGSPWAANTAYNAGDRVYKQNTIYEAHLALVHLSTTLVLSLMASLTGHSIHSSMNRWRRS